jgi:hypothetical protein
MAVPVRITREGRIVDADRVVKVRFSRKEDVLWIAQDNGGPWTITFEVTPFSQSTYTVPKGRSGGSTGGPLPGTQGKAYRYTVSDANGKMTDEREVDVVDDSPKTHNVTHFSGTTTSR